MNSYFIGTNFPKYFLECSTKFPSSESSTPVNRIRDFYQQYSEASNEQVEGVVITMQFPKTSFRNHKQTASTLDAARCAQVGICADLWFHRWIDWPEKIRLHWASEWPFLWRLRLSTGIPLQDGASKKTLWTLQFFVHRRGIQLNWGASVWLEVSDSWWFCENISFRIMATKNNGER